MQTVLSGIKMQRWQGPTHRWIYREKGVGGSPQKLKDVKSKCDNEKSALTHEQMSSVSQMSRRDYLKGGKAFGFRDSVFLKLLNQLRKHERVLKTACWIKVRRKAPGL